MKLLVKLLLATRVESETFTPKRRGRPKGSKNKNNGDTAGENQEMTGLTKGCIGSVVWTTIPMGVESETTTLAGAEDRKIPGEGTCANGKVEIIAPKKRGRPKGSKKEKNLAGDNREMPGETKNDSGNRTTRSMQLESERITFEGSKDKELPDEVNGGNGIITPNRRGRPKGSKNKKQNLASGEAKVSVDSCDKTIIPRVLWNERITLFDNEENGGSHELPWCIAGYNESCDNKPKRCIGMTTFSGENDGTMADDIIDSALVGEKARKLPSEATSVSEDGQEIVKPCLGQRMGSENRMKIPAGDSWELPTDIVDRNGDAGNIIREVVLENRKAGPSCEGHWVLSSEVIGHSREGNEIRKPRPRGRPKGSVKKKNLAGGHQELLGKVMNGNDGKDTVGLMSSENRVTALLGEEYQVLPGVATGHSGEVNDNIKSRRGRPKGSGNKKKNLAGGNQKFAGEVMYVNDGENVVRSMGLGNGMTTLIGEKHGALTGETTGHSEEGEIPKRKPGRPKGSKNKKTLAGGNQGLPGETMHGNYGGEKTLRLTSIQNGWAAPLCNEVKVVPCEVSGVSGAGNDTMKTNVQRHQPKSSESGRSRLEGEDDRIIPTEAAGVNEAGPANPQSEIECGQPEASKRKKPSISSEEEERQNGEFNGER
ncbi:hypothetical protein OIU76_022850 [Salix suchowensis]|nr:hypothetical protein OIU76_022850 [Salix suchowensis]